jgi:hypothetical protein
MQQRQQQCKKACSSKVLFEQELDAALDAVPEVQQ